MKIDRPLWAAGALLSPQQFQQQARWEAWANESLAHLALVHPWGVEAVGFDLQAWLAHCIANPAARKADTDYQALDPSA